MPDTGRSNNQNNRTIQSIWFGYIFAVLAELITTIGLDDVIPKIDTAYFTSIYILTIMTVAYFFGEGPALVAFVLGSFAYSYYFIPRTHGAWLLANTSPSIITTP